MTNITKNINQQQSLLAEAFAALLEKLGPEKTAQVWQVFIAPYGDYLKNGRHYLPASTVLLWTGRSGNLTASSAATPSPFAHP
jgi:hypothetical protein